MLRISVSDDPNASLFKLEGKLAHEWVAEAEKAWLTFSSFPRKERMVVDLCAVSFVDDAGRALLVRMHSSGAKLVGTGPMTGALVEEICGEARRAGRRWMRNILGLWFLLLVCALPDRNDLFHLVRSLSRGHLMYAIPGWALSLQCYVTVFWKGLFQ
jgi:ABC-type transporter Mla MlaB component